MEHVHEVLNERARWTVRKGDGLETLRFIGGVLKLMDKRPAIHVITDPPYSENVHKRVETGKRRELPDVSEFDCRNRRAVDLKFTHITQAERVAFAGLVSEVATRWVVVFSDAESTHLWREAFSGRGLARYFRTGAWWRLGGAPHFQGDGPAPGHEELLYWHARAPFGQRRRWNAGGKAASYAHPVVANRIGQRGSRVHDTQKPVPLMYEMLGDLVEPGDIVVDPYCGAGTTGVAALRLGCRFIGVELDAQGQGWAEVARDALSAAEDGSTLAARRAGQLPMFAAS